MRTTPQLATLNAAHTRQRRRIAQAVVDPDMDVNAERAKLKEIMNDKLREEIYGKTIKL